ncbi:MAG: hypothetical protein QM770_19040 [Tepidisphaeraceae bacterium]
MNIRSRYRGVSGARQCESLERRGLLAATIATQEIAGSMTAVAADPTRELFYVLDESYNLVQSFDPATGQTVSTVSAGLSPTAYGSVLAVDPAGHFLYALDSGGTLSTFSLPTLDRVATVTVSDIGDNTSGSLVATSDQRVYLITRWSNDRFGMSDQVVELNPLTGSVVRVVYQADDLDAIDALAMPSDGSALFVARSNFTWSMLTRVDLPDNATPVVHDPVYLPDYTYVSEMIADGPSGRLYVDAGDSLFVHRMSDLTSITTVSVPASGGIELPVPGANVVYAMGRDTPNTDTGDDQLSAISTTAWTSTNVATLVNDNYRYQSSVFGVSQAGAR